MIIESFTKFWCFFPLFLFFNSASSSAARWWSRSLLQWCWAVLKSTRFWQFESSWWAAWVYLAGFCGRWSCRGRWSIGLGSWWAWRPFWLQGCCFARFFPSKDSDFIIHCRHCRDWPPVHPLGLFGSDLQYLEKLRRWALFSHRSTPTPGNSWTTPWSRSPTLWTCSSWPCRSQSAPAGSSLCAASSCWIAEISVVRCRTRCSSNRKTSAPQPNTDLLYAGLMTPSTVLVSIVFLGGYPVSGIVTSRGFSPVSSLPKSVNCLISSILNSLKFCRVNQHTGLFLKLTPGFNWSIPTPHSGFRILFAPISP